MEELIKIIKKKSWDAILNYAKVLSDAERFATIKNLQTINIDRDIIEAEGSDLKGTERTAFYENRQQIDQLLNYFLITCTRNYEDFKVLEIKHEYGTSNPFYSFITTRNAEPLVSFYKLFPPDYLDKVIKSISKNSFSNINFMMLWSWYKNKWIAFDEPFFVNSLLVVPMFNRSTVEEANFLFLNKDALESVFLKFQEYETPVLDISKWQAKNGFVCSKVYEYWTEVIQLLQEKGYIFDRIIIAQLFESLLNNWKKLHLDWHVRLIKMFVPTDVELLENQHSLFSILGTGHPSLINFAMQCIQSVYKKDGFDKDGFIESFPMTFSNEKTGKSILAGLGIIEYFLANDYKIATDYRTQLSVLLMQADTKIQEKASNLMVVHFNDATLQETVAPYISYLKQSSKDILHLEEDGEAVLEEMPVPKTLVPISIPATWDELLLHIGTCIRTKSARDIDVFFEGLNNLQFDIPVDFEKQLKPYTKQLSGRTQEHYVMYIFGSFIECWIKKTALHIKESECNLNPIPFFTTKSQLLLSKLISKNNLPFLSTPTHEPFYIHPDILLDKLLQYEAQKRWVDLDDLIVACNRILRSEIRNNSTEKSKKLTGYYAEAIQYYFGVSDDINFTSDTLPLWTQIARLKNPDGVFAEFEESQAASYPTVVKPFTSAFEITVDTNVYATWYRLVLENNWNYSYYGNKGRPTYPAFYYNAASSPKASREDIAYQLSLNPQYLDGRLCRYIPDTASGNEVGEFEDCLYPLQFVVENQLHIYHSGWLYIAVCLLFEKKISRDLASEYIQLALSRKENLDRLARYMSELINLKFAPVNRFIEYLDKPNNVAGVMKFQLQILQHCIELFDKKNLPINSKKIIQYYKEWKTAAKSDITDMVAEKIKTLKK